MHRNATSCYNAFVERAQTPTDDLLVARLIARAPGSWEILLRDYGPLIAAACRRALARGPRPAGLGSVADASAEVVRALLERDMRLLRKYRSGSSLATYLCVIARSVTLKSLRGNPPGMGWMDATAGGDPVPEAAQASERAARLRKALGALSARDAKAVRLFHLEGLSYAEIARQTGLPAEQVGLILKRARERLRDQLGQDFPDSV